MPAARGSWSESAPAPPRTTVVGAPPALVVVGVGAGGTPAGRKFGGAHPDASADEDKRDEKRHCPPPVATRAATASPGLRRTRRRPRTLASAVEAAPAGGHGGEGPYHPGPPPTAATADDSGAEVGYEVSHPLPTAAHAPAEGDDELPVGRHPDRRWRQRHWQSPRWIRLRRGGIRGRGSVGSRRPDSGGGASGPAGFRARGPGRGGASGPAGFRASGPARFRARGPAGFRARGPAGGGASAPAGSGAAQCGLRAGATSVESVPGTPPGAGGGGKSLGGPRFRRG